jgi:hypothetical protein
MNYSLLKLVLITLGLAGTDISVQDQTFLFSCIGIIIIVVSYFIHSLSTELRSGPSPFVCGTLALV